MIKQIDDKRFYIWFLALTCFLIGFLIGYGVAFNYYGSEYFNQFSDIRQPQGGLKNRPPNNDSISIKKPMSILDQSEKNLIEQWIRKNDLNEFGDPNDTVYAGGTPLFSGKDAKVIDRFDYIISNHPDKPWLKQQ